MEDDKWKKIAKMINDAKSIGVNVKSLSRNPLNRGKPEKNTKLAILIVENGIEKEDPYEKTISFGTCDFWKLTDKWIKEHNNQRWP